MLSFYNCTIHWLQDSFIYEMPYIYSRGLFTYAVSVTDVRMIDKWWIGKDLEGRGHGLIEVLSQHSSGVIKENHENPHSGYLLMNWNWLWIGRSQICDTVLEFIWRDWEKQGNSVTIADVPTEIATEHLPGTILKRYSRPSRSVPSYSFECKRIWVFTSFGVNWISSYCHYCHLLECL